MKNTKKIITFLCILGMAVSMTACSANSKTTDAGQGVAQSVETVVEDELVKPEPAKEPEKEETAPVVEEPVDEPIVEEPEVDDTSNLSNDEWVKSLDLEEKKFLIFNEITGNRKVLENGQQYTLEDGDMLAIGGPIGKGVWRTVGITPDVFYKLNYDEVLNNNNRFSLFLDTENCIENLTEGEYTELIYAYKDPDGNIHYTTLYLTK